MIILNEFLYFTLRRVLTMNNSDKEKFLSIVVPVYNSFLYINQCVDSFLNQDIPTDDYEIIIIDDGSDNGSEDILDEIAQNHSNIFVYHKENKGVSSARNMGISLSCGKYVWFVDADDFIAPNILGSLKKITENQNSDRVKLESFSFHNELSLEEVKCRLENGELKSNVPYKEVMATRTLYKREYLIKNNIMFLEGVHYGEDGVFNYQTLIHNPKTTQSGVLAYFYRVHDASATNAPKEKRVKKSLEGSKYIFDVLVDDYNKKICVIQTKRMLLYWMYAVIGHYSVLSYDYFCENFIWEHKLEHIPLRDFELRRLYRVLQELSKTHNYKKLKKTAESIAKNEQRKKAQKAVKKKILGYIKHPKRLLKIIFKK